MQRVDHRCEVSYNASHTKWLPSSMRATATRARADRALRPFGFEIEHYAGAVVYSTHGLVRENEDKEDHSSRPRRLLSLSRRC